MRVKCLALLPDDMQSKCLGNFYRSGQVRFNVKIGQEYVVFGITFMGGSPWIEVISQSNTYLYTVPLCLFEIVDGRVSQYWTVKIDKDGDLSLRPPSFYQPYYHDDLSEGVPEIVEDFRRVRFLIENE